jgi:polysaccharide export outer membrane protein
MFNENRLATVACFFVVLLAGCGGAPIQNSASPLPPPDAEPYILGPGDSLQIFVWDHPELSTTVQVLPDGRITSPLVEDLQAAGKSTTQLARDIEGVLGAFVRSPVVTVSVQGVVGETAQQIRVVGQAVAPRALQYRQGMTVLDVVIEVGGLSEFAAGNRSRIVRSVNGAQTEIRVRLDELLNEGQMDQNVRMVPGDVLFIPESRL